MKATQRSEWILNAPRHAQESVTSSASETKGKAWCSQRPHSQATQRATEADMIKASPPRGLPAHRKGRKIRNLIIEHYNTAELDKTHTCVHTRTHTHTHAHTQLHPQAISEAVATKQGRAEREGEVVQPRPTAATPELGVSRGDFRGGAASGRAAAQRPRTERPQLLTTKGQGFALSLAPERPELRAGPDRVCGSQELARKSLEAPATEDTAFKAGKQEFGTN